MKTRSLVVLILLLAACQHLPAAGTGAGTGRVAGLVTDAAAGDAVEGAYVYAYRESNTHYLGPPNHLSQPSGADGRYVLDLPTGTFQLFARKRASGQYQGPLVRDDLFDEGPGRKVKVTAGGATVDFEMQRLAGQQFYRPERFGRKTTTGVSGRIRDAAGKPVFGAVAFAYSDMFRKQLPPGFASLASDREGNYILYLDTGGAYVIGGRINVKEPPEKGEPVGFYLGDRSRPLTVPTGTVLRDIDIVLAPFAGDPSVPKATLPLQY